MYAPMGDGGVYEYVEPWYGFAVKKESDAQDYAVEFLRFMARQDELNTLASIKGVQYHLYEEDHGLQIHR